MTWSTSLRTDVRRSDSGTTVHVCGELDVATSDALARTLTHVARGRPGVVVVDLAGLAFMDARGLSVLLEGRRAVAATGGQLCLASPSAMVRRMLRLLRLDEVLPVTGPPAGRAQSPLAQNRVGVPGSRPRSSS